MKTISDVGDSIRDENELDELLSDPTPGVLETFGKLDGDVLVLGVAGKMGPTLALMARRAFDAVGKRHKVLGVARFSEASRADWLRDRGIEPIACDLLDFDQIERLPDAPNVVFMAGMKFGSTGQTARTWAMNCLVPAIVSQRYRASRIVAFSTGNVYGLTPINSGGSTEDSPLDPKGEYAMSCLGRERMIEYMSLTYGTPAATIRLNYANEPRYGTLVDLARKVYEGQPIDLAMGYFNAIWQGDANAQILQSFDAVASPPRILNVAGPELLSVRQTAEEFGRIFGKPVRFQGTEAPDALLSNTARAVELFGPPRVPIPQVMRWIADWIARGGPLLGKPTHFEVRDGAF